MSEEMTDASANLPRFGAQPGELVPQVDADDLKATWEYGQKLQAEHPGVQVAMGAGVAESICKSGADIRAIGYRSSMIWIVTRIAPEQVAPFLKDGQPTDAVFRAASKVRLQWMGVGIVRQGPPFDVNEFLRLCAEHEGLKPNLTTFRPEGSRALAWSAPLPL